MKLRLKSKDRTAVLHALHKNKEELKIRIEVAKKKNDAKFSELRETLNAYPEYFHFVQLEFAQADLHFGQEKQEPQSAAKKVIDVNKGQEIHLPR